jgi:hypothetical protein
MTSRPEVSPDVVAVDLSRFSSRTFCSWNDLGWRSVLLCRFENAPATDNVYHAPVKDQLLVLVTRGLRARCRRRRRRCTAAAQLASQGDPVNVYPFIEAEKQGSHNVKRACELLEVSCVAYYAARAGQPQTGTARRQRRPSDPGTAWRF